MKKNYFFFMVISVNRRLFRYFGSYSGISVNPVILVNRRTPPKVLFGGKSPFLSLVGPCSVLALQLTIDYGGCQEPGAPDT